MKLTPNYFSAAFLAVFASVGFARNVDLATVPNRDSVKLTIYNTEDLTLVHETRTLTFKKGINGLQFSWANTLIDPSSVELRFLNHADKLDILDTTFPHDKPQMLNWNVISEFDGAAQVEISYFTSGISWTADYTLISDVAEENLALEGYVRITNNSGEDYDDAYVRLVVGEINLVEKIADLAALPEYSKNNSSIRRNVVMKAIRTKSEHVLYEPMECADAELMEDCLMAPYGGEAKEIEKEGLSEYFIFSIPGTENIPNGWSKRLRSMDVDKVPFKVQYRYRLYEYGDQLVRMYILRNDKDSELGVSPLPNGQVRVFRNNGRDGLSYLGEETIKYVPIGDKVEINLGKDSEVTFESVHLASRRENIVMRISGVNVYKPVTGVAKLEKNAWVARWDECRVMSQRICNFTDKPIEVESRLRLYGGDYEFRSEIPGIKSYDYRTVEFTVTIPAGEQHDTLYELADRNGYPDRQNRVVLVMKAIQR